VDWQEKGVRFFVTRRLRLLRRFLQKNLAILPIFAYK